MKTILRLLKDAGMRWYDKDADYAAATVSYYALFAITPLLLLTVTLIGLVFGREYIAEVLLRWGAVLTPDVAALLQEAVLNLGALSANFGIPLVGAVFFSGMVVVMCNAITTGLHNVWGIPHEGVRGWVKKTINSVLFIIALELYLLIIVGLSKLTEFLTTYIDVPLATLVQVILILAATTILFSLIYHILPWRTPSLKSRIVGSLVASVLFVAAKVGVVWYVAFTPVPDLFGTAGLLLILLIWIYVITSIVYFGAAVAYAYDGKTLPRNGRKSLAL